MIQQNRKWQRGASLVHWIVALLALFAFGALAIDFSMVYVSQAQLQNAADAGALEGARVLYCRNGDLNHTADTCEAGQPSANDAATAAAQANVAATWRSSNNAQQVEVDSVERGHWEFRSDGAATDDKGIERGGVFTANPTTTPGTLLNEDGTFRSWQSLNVDPAEINAVRVVTARADTPVSATLARLLGIQSFTLRASAVGYVGFAATINPGEVDVPLALCMEYVTEGCGVGRMISQGEQTGGWTNFEQPGGESGTCSGAASSTEVNGLITDCFGEANLAQIVAGWEMQTTNGEVQNAFSKLFDCYNKTTVGQGANTFPGRLDEFDTNRDGQPDVPWRWTVPVIDCSGGITGQCNTVLGAVEVDVLWMFDSTNNVGQLDTDAPRQMTRTGPDGAVISWNAVTAGQAEGFDPSDGLARWSSFVSAFDIRQPDPAFPDDPTKWIPAEWRQKSLYFAPECEPVDLSGNAGGANFGVRAAVPVLVF
jgi:Flp pilus assembly protein TadG